MYTIDKCGATRFHNYCGVNVGSFLDLLSYLHTAVVSFNNEPFVHRLGVCTGSGLVPSLGDCLLLTLEREIQETAHDSDIVREIGWMLRYVTTSW